jgi:pimeloyl-ACP methyl ester carboxylesterase
VPIEYFETAAKLLGGPVVVSGTSRGSEAALLLAQHDPAIVRGAILNAPSNAAGRGYPSGANAWTLGGKPVPVGPIPVTHLAGQHGRRRGGPGRRMAQGPGIPEVRAVSRTC